jgi:hypothetical protein
MFCNAHNVLDKCCIEPYAYYDYAGNRLLCYTHDDYTRALRFYLVQQLLNNRYATI